MLFELERVSLTRRSEAASEAPDTPLLIPDAGPGSGDAWLSGRVVHVVWGGPEVSGALDVATFSADALRFPLRVRAREAGDRIRLPGGTKKVKKLLLEARVPRTERESVPLVVDAEGDVLWVPGVARAAVASAADGALTIGIG